jgi:hypothetical protein
MPKFCIACDERYPDYCLSTLPGYGTEVELTDEELARGREAEHLYNEWQLFIEKKYKANR